jgi:hypothetical protein
MKLVVLKALWGMEGPLEPKLDAIVEAGYDGIETPLFMTDMHPDELKRGCQSRNLRLVGQAFPRSLDEFKEHAEGLLEAGVGRINCHTGKDWFAFEEGVALFQAILKESESYPCDVIHETHRGRILFHPQITRRYLEELPDLKLCADFSHWACVCESLLEDQEDALDEAIEKSVHVHCRIGYEQGPQVPEPRDPHFARARERFYGLWRKTKQAFEARGDTEMVVVPEYGPPDYMHTLPLTEAPVADLWTVCHQEAEELRKALG